MQTTLYWVFYNRQIFLLIPKCWLRICSGYFIRSRSNGVAGIYILKKKPFVASDGVCGHSLVGSNACGPPASQALSPYQVSSHYLLPLRSSGSDTIKNQFLVISGSSSETLSGEGWIGIKIFVYYWRYYIMKSTIQCYYENLSNFTVVLDKRFVIIFAGIQGADYGFILTQRLLDDFL